MIKNKLKRVLAVALAGMMVAGVAGCSSSKDAKKNNTAKSEQGTEATTESKANTTADYVASNVTLPDNFDNMIYPIEALSLFEELSASSRFPSSFCDSNTCTAHHTSERSCLSTYFLKSA